MKAKEDMAINIIIDDSDPNNTVFVEIENDQGESICIGERLVDDSGLTKIRISIGDIFLHKSA